MFKVAVIGCGRRWKTPGATGFGMSHEHADGYKASQDCRIVAISDLREDLMKEWQEKHGADRLYTDYHKMLEVEKPDIVSISTWPHRHAAMVIDCADAGVKAIHCEKPMALTWGECRKMVQVCNEKKVQLTFNHQRRFLEPFRKAKQLLDEGAIGKLIRLEASCGDLYDWATHWLDMLFMYNDETPAVWVIGQMDFRTVGTVFGAPKEQQGLSHFKFANGVHGLLVTGFEAGWEANNRLIGTEGVIEVGPNGVKDAAGKDVHLRMMNGKTGGWRNIATKDSLHGGTAIREAILDVVECLKTGKEPVLAARKAIQSTEVIFATFESCRKRGRVDLPLTIEDSPLIALADAAGIQWRVPLV